MAVSADRTPIEPEDAVRTLAALAGFVARIAHQIDSLEMVEDLIIAGYSVGLLPIGRQPVPASRCYQCRNRRRC